MSKSNIHIKKSKVGSLHAHLGIKQGTKIPRSKLKIKASDSPAIRKKKQFALNMHGHKDMGGPLDYSLGSWLSKIGDFGVGVADTMLSQFGAGNVIGDNAYSSKKAAAASNTMQDKLGSIVGSLPLVGQISSGLQKMNTNQSTEDIQNQDAITRQNNLLFGQNRLAQYNAGNQGMIPTFASGGDLESYNKMPGDTTNVPIGGFWSSKKVATKDMTVKDIEKVINGLSGRVIDILTSYEAGEFRDQMLDANQKELNKYMSIRDKKPHLGKNPVDVDAISYANGGHLPEGNSTLKEAQEFLKLYPEEMNAGTEVEYEHTGNKKLAQRIAADHVKDSIKINQGGPPDYYKKLQAAGISDEMNKMPQMMAMGGKLSSGKAKEILKDGTIRGKKITDRQRRYFGFIARGGTPKMADGGPFKDHQPKQDLMPWRNDFNYNNIEVQDNRKIDMASGLPMTDKNRMGAIANKDYVKKVSISAAKNGVNPYTALAMQMQESGNLTNQNNPFKVVGEMSPENYDSLRDNPVDYSTKFMKDKFDYAKRLGKTSEADIIQSWNGYGKVGKEGQKYYGMDAPIDMSKNPVYGNRIKNIQDSILMRNPELVKLVRNSTGYANGGYFGPAGSISGGIGSVPSFGDQNPVTQYKGGGTHEQNNLGGIPVGGKAKVEEGEVRIDFPEGSYIFSNRY